MLRRHSCSSLLTGLIVLLFAGSLAAQEDTTPAAPPLLKPKLDSMIAGFEARAPKDKIDLYQGAITDLAASGILESALNVGDTVPEFALPSAVGDTVSLSRLLAGGPVIVVWYRGGWCPYCNATLAAWRAYLPQVKAAGARLVAISPELPDKALSTKEKHELPFEVLSDPDNTVARQFGIVFTLPDKIADAYSNFFSMSEFYGNERNELPLASTYIINPDRTIRYAFLDADYKHRAEPGDVIGQLQDTGAK